MTVFQSVILGIIQGITEFLPISSSGHLVVVPYLFRWDIPPDEAFVFDVLVQVATLVAVLAYFWQDFYHILRAMLHGIQRRQPLATQHARLGWYILLASIPAAIAGILLKDILERAFSNPIMTSIALFGTAILLVIAEQVGARSRKLENLTWQDALIIGLFQILALFPGLSRSGSTISGAMTRNFNRPTAARFSFLMAVPIMLAAGLLATIDLLTIPNLGDILPVFIPGFIASAVVGYLAIGWLISFLNRYSLYYFAAYCTLIAAATLLIAVF